jgi:hypothetical protein
MMGDVGGKRTKIDPWRHKAVKISGRQPLLNHASVDKPRRALLLNLAAMRLKQSINRYG